MPQDLKTKAYIEVPLDALTLSKASGLSVEKAGGFLPFFLKAFSHAKLDTKEKKAAFIAQVMHETGGLKWVRELWGPTPAQKRYEGRLDLGNLQEGDGKRFMGRGWIQVTGRFNYRSMSERLAPYGAPNFELNPKELESPEWAAMSAAEFWNYKRLNQFFGSKGVRFVALTKEINGGRNGLEDRQQRYERAIAAL